MYYYYVCGEIMCCHLLFYEVNTPKTNIPLEIINQTKSSKSYISVFFFSVSQANLVTHMTQNTNQEP